MSFQSSNQSRFHATKKQKKKKKKKQHQPRLSVLSSRSTSSFNLFSSLKLATLTSSLIALIYCTLSMSMFYQVVGAVKCRKIKKHSGIKLRPTNKAKEPFMPNDMLLYICESTEHTQTIKCQEDGTWTEPLPCPDPANFTCPDLEALQHGSFLSSSDKPYRVGTMVSFSCENEPPSLARPSTNTAASAGFNSNNQQMVPTTTTSDPQNNFLAQNISAFSENITAIDVQPTLRYNLTGHRVIKCLPSAKWSFPAPTCEPIYPDPPSNVGFLLASTALILVPILILIVFLHLFMRWRKRQQQRERWKQYFTDYKYRHSKTSITFANRPNPQTTVTVTDL